MKHCLSSILTCLLIALALVGSTDAKAITLNVGETYTCDIGYVSNLVGCQWTTGDYSALDFVSTPGTYSTSATVKALKESSVPIVVQCTYYYRELDPVSGRYIYQRTGFKSWTFFIHDPNPQPQSVTVSPSSLTLNVGESYPLSCSVSPSNADQSVSWWSNNSTVASVSYGMVTANSPGTAYITATASNGVEGYCEVYVRSAEPTSVELPESKTIKIGQGIQLTPTLYPSYATTSYTWRSNDSQVAKVSSSGYVTGVAEGNTRIYVTTANGLSDYCEVEVYKPVPSSVSFTNSPGRMAVGATKRLSVSVSPSDAIYTLTWSSDAPHVLEVNQQGQITALSAGLAHITVTTDNGRTATCAVTVAPEPSGLSLTPTFKELLMGRSFQLNLVVQPADALALNYTWTSSASDVAGVSQAGEVTAYRPGESVITVESSNGCTASAKIVVPMPLYQLFVVMRSGIKTGYLSTDKPQFCIEGDNIHLSTNVASLYIPIADFDHFTLEQVLPEHPTEISLPNELKLGLNTSASLDYILTPADAQTTVTWFTSDENVVQVSANGVATAVGVGSAVITAQTSNGLRAECMVIVPEPQWTFYVVLSDGSVNAYLFSEKPEVQVSAEMLTLTTTRQTVVYSYPEVKQFMLGDASISELPLPIESIADESDSRLEYESGNIIMYSLRPFSDIYIYDVSGHCVSQCRADANGNASLPLSNLARGIYIVKTETTTYKIQKR